MTDDDDYERVEDYLDDNDNDIFMQYGDTFDKLDNTKKEQVFIDKFFRGLDAYAQSAEELRIGYDEYRKGTTENTEVIHFMRGGKNIHVVRDKTTRRFVRWIR